MPKKWTPESLRSRLDSLRFMYALVPLFVPLSFNLSMFAIDRFALEYLCFDMTLIFCFPRNGQNYIHL